MSNLLYKNLSFFGFNHDIIDSLTSYNITTAFKLLLHIPKSVIVHAEVKSLSEVRAKGHYVLIATVYKVKLSGIGKKKRLSGIIKDDLGHSLEVIFFGPAVNYASKKLKEGETVKLSGQVTEFMGSHQMVHPKFIAHKDSINDQSLLVTYPQIAGIGSNVLQKMISKVLHHISGHISEHLANDFLQKHLMSSLDQAINFIHTPSPDYLESLHNKAKNPYFRRLAFEELISFYVTLLLQRKRHQHEISPKIALASIDSLVDNFLPFTLTKAQEIVIKEIIHDLAGNTAMCRLLQGDVGCGKTAVSAVIAKHVMASSWQVAIMAPTEILAEQLFNTFTSFFAQSNYRLALFTAQTKNIARKNILSSLEKGDIHLIIGTHALLSESIHFHRLGLVIIDEQHRFGVNQRASLISEAQKHSNITPHMLVMSATPIPRSLALTYYGDLTLSIINEKPVGRLPIHTQMMTGNIWANLKRLGERVISTSRKAFIVFPLLEESEHFDLENASKAVQFMSDSFGNHTCKLIHGKMKAEEKSLIMHEFRHQALPFLVATSVVEVGIDVPNASCMAIIHPERFGLAQLHQLRGRVGRGSEQGYCLLLSEKINIFSDTYKRLQAFTETNDGFKLAEIDLNIRGPGEMLGIKQSGLAHFWLANHDDFPDLFPLAKTYAQSLVSNSIINDPYAHLFPQHHAHFS